VFIDKDGGVNLDDCANVSRGLNLILDVDDAIPGSGYNLEVSSPGLERFLREARHFSKTVGSVLQVKLKEPRENLRAFRGRLLELEGFSPETETSSDVQLLFELENGSRVKIRVDEVQKARLVFVDTKQPPKGGRRR
jgi:ribosome maturation factor RimP